MIASQMEQKRKTTLYSSDTDFDEFTWLTRA
jgi:hypothetical protein